MLAVRATTREETALESTPVQPFAAALDAANGLVTPEGPRQERRLSDLEGLYADVDAWRAAVQDGDPLVYAVSVAPVPEQPGEVPFSTPRSSPGRSRASCT
jgi:glucose-6-phosphate isomerase